MPIATILKIFMPMALAASSVVAAQAPLAPMFDRDVVYSQADGVDLKLDFARPGEGPGPFPLVVCIHGGGWQSGAKSGYAMAMGVLAQRGYASASIEYRLAPKYQFPAQLQDVRRAVQYLRAHAAELKVDPSRIAVIGDSAGGHLALLLGLTDPKDGIRAVINLYGPTDLPRWQATPAGEVGLGMTSAKMLENVFGTSDRTSEVLRAASPINNIGKTKPAVITFHGDADPVVKVEQGIWLHEALRKAGIEEKLVIVKGASHGFQGADLQTVIQGMVEFLGTHLKAVDSKVNIPRIDAHAHVGPPPEAFLQMLERLSVRMVDVTLIDPHAPGFDKTEPQTGWVAKLTSQSRGRIAWASTFDPAGFDTPGFMERTNQHLQSTFDRGAVAVKIYKSVGMDLKSASGGYVMPDNPAFGPVFDMISSQNRTLMAHLGEPRSSWQPLNPADPHYGYYKGSPDWHMYLHPERPSYESIIAARDRMLAAHPKLRVIGCHLGSMEHDVDEIAKRLDLYPNFAVDTAARVVNLMIQPRDKVRAFLIKYQDRVLWGTDLMELTWADPAAALKRWEATYDHDWKYFATAETFDFGGKKIQGLALPPEVLRKIFHGNALRWMPGLASAACCGGLPRE